ncbi:MAG: TIM barrel protein [Planctomycetes bacterium]|nr:TIM barrel protein [Planctomycetota bacterium]
MLTCLRSTLPANPDELEAHFEGLAASGTSNVEIVYPRLRLGQSFLTQSHCRSLLQAAGKHGVRICSVSTDGLDIFDLADPNPAHQQASLDGFEELLRAAAWLGDGTGLIIGAHDVHCLKDISVGGYEVAFNRVFVSVESLVRKAEKLCVELHIENPGGGLLLSPLELREFLDEINSPYIGLCFNPAYASHFTDPLDWFSIMDRRIRAVRMPLGWKDEALDAELHDKIIERLGLIQFAGPIVYTDVQG